MLLMFMWYIFRVLRQIVEVCGVFFRCRGDREYFNGQISQLLWIYLNMGWTKDIGHVSIRALGVVREQIEQYCYVCKIVLL